ncbi:MAG: hypothetical protein GX547_12965 [Phycisphaerae bacterium]|nr:hypothetical protein [Phycisphaerae bacterium]
MSLRARYLLTAASLLFSVQRGFADTRTELPPNLDQELAAIQDFTYDFDHPAYYHLLAFVQNSLQAPGFNTPPIVVDDWRVLIERPADYRGLPVTVEGVVGRNKDPYVHPRHPELRPVSQVELSRPDQAVSCTLIFTQDVADIPIGATLQATGYFVKINRFPRQSGEPGLSALIVASGPSQVSRTAGRTSQTGPDWRWMVLAVLAGLIITVIMLRRARGFRRHNLRELHAEREPRINLAADLEDWAKREPPDCPPPQKPGDAP